MKDAHDHTSSHMRAATCSFAYELLLAHAWISHAPAHTYTHIHTYTQAHTYIHIHTQQADTPFIYAGYLTLGWRY